MREHFAPSLSVSRWDEVQSWCGCGENVFQAKVNLFLVVRVRVMTGRRWSRVFLAAFALMVSQSSRFEKLVTPSTLDMFGLEIRWIELPSEESSSVFDEFVDACEADVRAVLAGVFPCREDRTGQNIGLGLGRR